MEYDSDDPFPVPTWNDVVMGTFLRWLEECLWWRDVMINGYHALHPPTVCHFCEQPFKLSQDKDGGHYSAYRHGNRLYCSQDCYESERRFEGDVP